MIPNDGSKKDFHQNTKRHISYYIYSDKCKNSFERSAKFYHTTMRYIPFIVIEVRASDTSVSHIPCNKAQFIRKTNECTYDYIHCLLFRSTSATFHRVCSVKDTFYCAPRYVCNHEGICWFSSSAFVIRAPVCFFSQSECLQSVSQHNVLIGSPLRYFGTTLVSERLNLFKFLYLNYYSKPLTFWIFSALSD
jgi:hypothetical protein